MVYGKMFFGDGKMDYVKIATENRQLIQTMLDDCLQGDLADLVPENGLDASFTIMEAAMQLVRAFRLGACQ